MANATAATGQQSSAVPAGVNDKLLAVSGLSIALRRRHSEILVVDGVDFTLTTNSALGVVGESGSGKSMLSRALIGTLGRYGARVSRGSIRWDGRELVGLEESSWRRIRGFEIGYVPQSSMAALNPIMTVGAQLREALVYAGRSDGGDWDRQILDLLDQVHIPRAKQVMRERANQLSGGMRQRVIIAAALARRPRLLILDEPTTALDVTVQAGILRLISELRAELGMAVMLTSHDLAVVESVCEQVMTMYAGAAIEIGSTASVHQSSLHPYTQALMASRVDEADPAEDLVAIGGEPPTAGQWPPGCRFHPRCPHKIEACAEDGQPPMRQFSTGKSACIRTGEWAS